LVQFDRTCVCLLRAKDDLGPADGYRDRDPFVASNQLGPQPRGPQFTIALAWA